MDLNYDSLHCYFLPAFLLSSCLPCLPVFPVFLSPCLPVSLYPVMRLRMNDRLKTGDYPIRKKMEHPSSYAWRGPSGCGKRTRLLTLLTQIAEQGNIPFRLENNTWYVNKPTLNSDPDDDDESGGGKSIPYEESPLHLGFDVARMSMSDKIFLQSILSRWTGQQDLCLIHSTIKTRYLVLYHAHLLTDESVLQLQECLEQYPSFAILLTTELPVCPRLRDFCFEIPVAGEDRLLQEYNAACHFPPENVWLTLFQKTAEEWSQAKGGAALVIAIRNWIYMCLQRNLRWTDMVMYWIQTVYRLPWLNREDRAGFLTLLWNAESGAGWKLITSYRIPMIWEHLQLKLARYLYRARNPTPTNSMEK